MNDIIFVKGEGGLGRPLEGTDHVSGILVYSAAVPSLPFSTTNRNVQIFSLEQAEALGITSDSVNFDVLHYHLSEFFRINPKGNIWVGVYAVPGGAYDFAEVLTMQRFVDGEIKQLAVYVGGKDYATADVTALQAVVNTLEAEHRPLEIIYGADISGTADITTIATLATLTAPNVSVCIGQDGAGVGAALYVSKTYSITCIGALLGAISIAKVSESVAWVQKFQLATTELDVAAFANGQKFRDLAASAIDALNTKRYIFLIKHTGQNGTYFNDSHTAVAVTSDYAYIESNRTISKAIRNIRTSVLPKLNGPIKVNADGTLSADSIAVYETLAGRPLEQMVNNDELSAQQIIINPVQNVLSTSELVIAAELVPIGVGRKIKINIGFKVKLSA